MRIAARPGLHLGGRRRRGPQIVHLAPQAPGQTIRSICCGRSVRKQPICDGIALVPRGHAGTLPPPEKGGAGRKMGPSDARSAGEFPVLPCGSHSFIHRLHRVRLRLLLRSPARFRSLPCSPRSLPSTFSRPPKGRLGGSRPKDAPATRPAVPGPGPRRRESVVDRVGSAPEQANEGRPRPESPMMRDPAPRRRSPSCPAMPTTPPPPSFA